jgi:pimeloyl-ACP methyl ester carboxylesterase
VRRAYVDTPKGLRRAYVDIPEGQVHYVTAGSGQPLILLHLSPRSWTAYRRIIPHLATEYSVIAMDTLGFGNSDDAPEGFEIPDYARSVVHFLDALGIADAHLWGSMTGSRIAAEVAAGWPDRVRGLILMGFPLFLTEEERNKRIEEAKKQARWVTHDDGSHLVRMWELAILRAGAPEAHGQLSDLQREFVSDSIVDGVRAGGGYMEAAIKVYSHDPKPRLPLIKAPTLVIDLGGERMHPYVSGRSPAVHQLIPGSRIAKLDDPRPDQSVTYLRAKELTVLVRSFLGETFP